MRAGHPFIRTLVLLSLTGCADPVRAEKIAALGGEASDVPVGPLHRPGQPCLLCHDDEGGRAGRFSLAGTIYVDADGQEAVKDAVVHVEDAAGARFSARSNCAGNFWIDARDGKPTYPLRISVSVDGQALDMESLVFREGSCAACHSDPRRPDSAGHVYVLADPDDPRPGPEHTCR
jgi:hypothetical protein